MIALTLNVYGINPVTLCVKAAELVQTLNGIEEGLDDAAKARQNLTHYANLTESQNSTSCICLGWQPQDVVF
jgi:hypothetical protein